jgi:hypothetical protein
VGGKIVGREPWTDQLEYLVRKLSEALTQVKDEQSYIVVRERVHRNTAESTNGRVKWWSMFQLAVVIGEGVFQVWWLKRFFEVCWFLQLGCDPRWRWDANSFLICRSSVWSDLDLSLLRIEYLFLMLDEYVVDLNMLGFPVQFTRKFITFSRYGVMRSSLVYII